MSKSKISRPHQNQQQGHRSHHQKQQQIASSDQQQSNQNEQQQQQNKQPSIQFGDSPIQMKCPFCLQNIRTQIILKPQFISILFGFSLFIIFPHILTLILTIVALQITATRKHRCPLCQRELGSDGKFLVFFKDQVYSFAFGTNGIIITKKILSTIGIGIVIFIVLSLKINNAYADVEWTQLKWPQYFRQCPFENNSEKCSNSNQGLTVKNWYGFVMRVQDNRNSIKKHFQHAVSIFLKMNDPQSLLVNPQIPDLLLTITSYQAHQWQQSLDKLSHGDQIVFNGTFRYLRNNRGIPIGRHLNLIDMNRTGINNPNIHIYMSSDEDLWFFENLSGEKLRKHKEQIASNPDKKQQKQIQKLIQKETGKVIQTGTPKQTSSEQKISPTDTQKGVLQDVSPENNI